MSEEKQSAVSMSGDKEAVRREARFVEIGKLEGKAMETRMRGLFSKWVSVEPLKVTERQELLDYKIIKPKIVNFTTQSGANDICEGQSALAVRMTMHYADKYGTRFTLQKISKVMVSNWIRLKTPEAAANPPPGKKEGMGDRYSLSAWIAWFDKYLLQKYLKDGGSEKIAGADEEEDINLVERKEKLDAIKHRRWERDIEKGKYTLKTSATWTASGLGVAARNAARDVLENKLVLSMSEHLEAFIPDESLRSQFIEKVRRDGVYLFGEFQNQYRISAEEVLKKDASASEKT